SSCSVVWLPPRPTLFPYTTLFRSRVGIGNDLYGLCRGAASAAARWAATLTTVVAARAAAADEEQRGRHRSDRHLPNSHACLLDSDRKSTRLNSSHQIISYAVFCLK